MHVIDSLGSSDIDFILTRHESSAAFMAGMVGRLTQSAGCMFDHSRSWGHEHDDRRC